MPVPSALSDAATVRMLIPAGYDAGDSSDGIPTASGTADSEVMASSGVVEAVAAPEPTRKLAALTLGETFAVLWALQGAAERSGVDLDVEPMPAHQPTGVHLWSSEYLDFRAWLRRERARDFACVAYERVVAPDKIESAAFLLLSLAESVSLMKPIEVGPKAFVHLAFRSGEGAR